MNWTYFNLLSLFAYRVQDINGVVLYKERRRYVKQGKDCCCSDRAQANEFDSYGENVLEFLSDGRRYPVSGAEGERDRGVDPGS